MKRYLFIGLILLGSCMAVFTGCGGKKTFEYGTVTDGVYRNRFFGVSMSIPEGMVITPREEMDRMVSELGSEAAAGELLLFISPEVPADSTPGYNLTITAEKIPSRLGIKNNMQYAAHALKLIDSSAAAPIVEYTRLGGREFVKIRIRSEHLNQDIYARYDAGYALILVGTYTGDDSRAAIDAILATVTFE